jgi:hypothetical protein
MAVILAALGAVLMAAAVGAVWLPAGVFWAGLELVTAGYVMRYLEARR